MGQKVIKNNRRSLQRFAQKEKSKIVSTYIADNWEAVVTSAVTVIRQFNLKNRLSIAFTIIFKPIKKKPPTKKPETAAGETQQT